MKKIVVGISGGIDSAITAYKLKAEGYQVIGAHLKVTKDAELPIEKLEMIGKRLEIPIEIIDATYEFNNTVLDTFRLEHLAGRTPSPCTICNPKLKWHLLNDHAIKKEANYIGSGHYIQKEHVNGSWYLKKANDKLKDQSYYLWGLQQSVLSKIITPLGSTTKVDVRKLASDLKLNFLTSQRESMGLCFAQGLSYADLIKKHIPETVKITEGDVINNHCEVIGKHKGHIYYTIGQERGIKYFNNIDYTPCVVSIDHINNRLIVGKDDELWRTEFIIENCSFINSEQILKSSLLQAKVRGIGLNPKGFARVKKIGLDKYKVKLTDPAWGIAPGQPVVFYENDYLLGGGFLLQ